MCGECKLPPLIAYEKRFKKMDGKMAKKVVGEGVRLRRLRRGAIRLPKPPSLRFLRGETAENRQALSQVRQAVTGGGALFELQSATAQIYARLFLFAI